MSGYLAATQPSFHLIPRGDAMASEGAFDGAYARLAAATKGFTDVSRESIAACLLAHPETLAPLRMVIGFTYNELAVAVRLCDSEAKTTGDGLRTFERKPAPSPITDRQAAARGTIAQHVANAIVSVMEREILFVPEPAAVTFHSKLDKRDTREGWPSVAASAGGVPYSALLYQRYVGGVWRQVQDAYSEVKGDELAELPVAALLDSAGISYWRTPRGATGAAQTANRYKLSPGPDFVMPEESPTVVLESKIGEDGGTVRDKASRIQGMARAAEARGLVPCAVIDGKGWRERPNALADVIIATNGRTYTLSTLELLLTLPEIAALIP
ncbi:MAG: hypothetical protein ACR2LA_02440 [Acidimicrobiales bacterium]